MRPLRELDLGDQPRLDPHHVRTANAGHSRHLRKRRLLALKGPQEPEQTLDLPVAETGSDVPGPAEPSRFVDGHDERAESARTASLATGVTDDDDLLGLTQLHLVPVDAPLPGPVPRIHAFGDDPLELLLAGCHEKRLPVLELRRYEDLPTRLDKSFESPAPLGEWLVEERLRIDLEQVEEHERKVPGSFLKEREA